MGRRGAENFASFQSIAPPNRFYTPKLNSLEFLQWRTLWKKETYEVSEMYSWYELISESDSAKKLGYDNENCFSVELRFSAEKQVSLYWLSMLNLIL